MKNKSVKVFLRILFYLSIGFLAIYLYHKDLLIIPDLNEPLFYLISVIIILFGFFSDAKAWQLILRPSISRITYKDAFISTGKYIFGKYVPGKLWVILGRAGFIKEKYKYNFFDITSISLYYQLISIFCAALIGLVVLYYIDIYWFLGIGIAMLTIIVFILFWFKNSITFISRILSKILKKEIRLPFVSTRITCQIILLSICNWFVWSIAFYLFLLSIQNPNNIDLKAGMLFPLASVVGIIVIFVPGGLGFREGMLTLGLTVLGMTAQEAASVAILSRLWFLIGELLFFTIAILLSLIPLKK